MMMMVVVVVMVMVMVNGDDGDGSAGGDGHPCQPCAGQQGRAQRQRAAESTFRCMGGNLRWMSTAGLVSFF